MPETHVLYGGLVELEYDDPSHEYRYNGQVVPNVTSITGIKNKPFLIPWALKVAGQYVLDNWPEEPSAVPTRVALVKGMKKAHEKVRDAAAGYGKEAHEWIEHYIHASLSLGEPPPMPVTPQVLSAVQAFLAWEREHRVHYLASERKIFSLAHVYAGTLDIMAEVDGVVTLLDLKTSNSYREDYALQTAAYVMAHNEEHHEDIRDRIVLMLHKETAQFNPVVLHPNRYERDVDGFLGARRLWQWDHDEQKLGKKWQA